MPKAAELCDLYSYARNTKTKLSDALVEQLPQAFEYKAQIAELMKAYEQRKQERNFLDYDDILSIVAVVHLQSSPELVNWVTGFVPHCWSMKCRTPTHCNGLCYNL